MRVVRMVREHRMVSPTMRDDRMVQERRMVREHRTVSPTTRVVRTVQERRTSLTMPVGQMAQARQMDNLTVLIVRMVLEHRTSHPRMRIVRENRVSLRDAMYRARQMRLSRRLATMSRQQG
jgi:hypothetical protein